MKYLRDLTDSTIHNVQPVLNRDCPAQDKRRTSASPQKDERRPASSPERRRSKSPEAREVTSSSSFKDAGSTLDAALQHARYP